MDKVKVARQMKRFEEYLMIDKGLSKVTATGYCRTTSIALRRMKKFVPQYKDIKQHIGWMMESEYSYSHLVNTSLALEHYAKSKNLDVKLARPRKPKRLVKDILTESEVSRILSATKTVRTRAIICLLAYSGLRNTELCRLRLEDVDLGANQIMVRDGKNRTDGVVNISAGCTKILIEYLKHFPREKESYLFTTLRLGSPLSGGDLRKIIRTASVRAKIGRRVHPHLFRHSLATNLLNRGGSLMMIQQQLRHRHIESTMVYVESRPQRNRSEYDFHQPAYL